MKKRWGCGVDRVLGHAASPPKHCVVGCVLRQEQMKQVGAGLREGNWAEERLDCGVDRNLDYAENAQKSCVVGRVLSHAERLQSGFVVYRVLYRPKRLQRSIWVGERT